jgi:chromosome segregation ATPase
MRASSTLVILCAAGLLAGPAVRADDSDPVERVKAALRSVTAELRAEQDQNATLTAKQAQNAREIAALAAERDALRAKAGDLQKQSDAAADEAKSTAGQLAQTQTALDQWKDAYQKAADTARTRDAAAKSFEAQTNDLTHRVSLCEAKNAELYNVGRDILNKLDDDDFVDKILRHEPFTGLARVKLDNIVQDYQDKLRDQRVKPPKPDPAAR